MKKTLFTIGIGAGLMYLFDPQHGSQRRAQLLDKIQGALPKTAEAVNSKMNVLTSKATDLTTRADDIAAEAVTTMPPQADAGLVTDEAPGDDTSGDETSDAAEVQPAS